MATKAKEVEAGPLETSVTLPISGSFYEDTIKATGIDPEAVKSQFKEFEKDIKNPLVELEKMVGSILATPTVTSRGSLPRGIIQEAE